MDRFWKIQESLAKREELLQESKMLEEKAREIRLNDEIKSVQGEIFNISDRIVVLEELVDVGVKLFYVDNEPITISLDDYQNYLIEGISLEKLEEELGELTKRLDSLFKLLEHICSYLGHDYRFIETKAIFDFDSMEPTFEDRHIYYCSRCGEAIYLDDKKDMELGNDRDKKLRISKKIGVYKSKFSVQKERKL